MGVDTPIVIGLNAAIVAVTREVPRVLTVRLPDHLLGLPGEEVAHDGTYLDALPFGPLDPHRDRTIELGLGRWVLEQTGLELGYVEQLYTFGDRHRDPAEHEGGNRVISVAYLALVREGGSGQAQWRDCYGYLPWEDWRRERPPIIDGKIGPALRDWAARAGHAGSRRRFQERADIAFGLAGAAWDEERVLERYELLYEAGCVVEQPRDTALGMRSRPESTPREVDPAPRNEYLGCPMALDHRRILATALGRLRGKIKYRPVVFELLSRNFTLLQLQRVVEALAGTRLHKQNFRRLVEKGGLVEGTGQFHTQTGGRPAELFRFRREVLRERPAPGVGLPGAARS